MNIPAAFIRRPVATALLMVAIVLLGATAYELLPVAALPNVAFPDHLGHGAVARRRPADHGLVGCDAARKAVRSDPVSDADDIDQLTGLHADRTAVRAERRHQCRGTTGADGHQRGGRPIAQEHALAADISRDQPIGCAYPGAWLDLRYAADHDGGRLRREHSGAEAVAGTGGRARRHRRHAAPGNSYSVQSGAARGEWPFPGGCADGTDQCERGSAERQPVRAGAHHHIADQRSDTHAGRLEQSDHRLSEWRTDQGLRRRQGYHRATGHDVDGVGEPQARHCPGRFSGCPAPT